MLPSLSLKFASAFHAASAPLHELHSNYEQNKSIFCQDELLSTVNANIFPVFSARGKLPSFANHLKDASEQHGNIQLRI